MAVPTTTTVAPQTSDDLIELICRSGLVAAPQLSSYLGPTPQGKARPADLLSRLIDDGLLTDFQAALLAQGKWSGFFVGGYKVLRLLGRGGYSRVFLAEHADLSRLVALKVLPCQRSGEQVVTRFHREARALASLDHPNIVRAYALDRQGDLLYLVMEYIKGTDLQNVVAERGPLDLALAIDVIRQAALGLGHAHEVGWIHRDVKPSNLLLGTCGSVKLLDLGLARLDGDDGGHLTRYQGGVLGTADYLAPEQSLDSSAVDTRADLYSLGATFYFLLTGRPPFDGGTVVQKIARHHAAAPRPIRLFRSDVPPELEAIVDRMMAKRPKHRYQSTGQVIASLAPWTGDKVGLAPPPLRSTAEASAKIPKRHERSLLGQITSLLGYLWGGRGKKP